MKFVFDNAEKLCDLSVIIDLMLCPNLDFIHYLSILAGIMFTTTFTLTGPKYGDGPLFHLDFDAILWACRDAQQRFLLSCDLDIRNLASHSLALHLRKIRDVSFRKEIRSGSEVTAEVTCVVKRNLYICFCVKLYSTAFLACEAYFDMVLIGHEGLQNLPACILSKLAKALH
jgi:hypothetical protein